MDRVNAASDEIAKTAVGKFMEVLTRRSSKELIIASRHDTH